jgi:hypothetical protein
VVAGPDCGFDAVFVLAEGVVEPDGELGVVEVDPLGAVLVTQGAGVVPGVLVCALPPGCTPGTGAGAVGVVPLCGVAGAGCVCGVDGEFCVWGVEGELCVCVVCPAALVVVVVGGPIVVEGVEVVGAPVGGGAVGVAAC